MSDGANETHDPLIGQTFAGRYAIVRRLGEGGMGNVYEGQHTLLGKRVAIKVLHAEFAAETENIKRFVNEARAAAMLRHPHIIDASDVGTTPTGEPFLVLEFLEGKELGEYLDGRGPMPISRTARIMRQIASALSAAHAQGIVHRDLKPQNVFLLKRPDGLDFVKVLDFGISKFQHGSDDGPKTRAGAQLGTPAFMAPEQFFDASKADARADIYAAGVMLYRMLTGQLPFPAKSYPELIAKVMAGGARPMRELRPSLPLEIEPIVARAMAVARDARFASMEELDAALKPWESFPDAESGPITHVSFDEDAEPRRPNAPPPMLPGTPGTMSERLATNAPSMNEPRATVITRPGTPSTPNPPASPPATVVTRPGASKPAVKEPPATVAPRPAIPPTRPSGDSLMALPTDPHAPASPDTGSMQMREHTAPPIDTRHPLDTAQLGSAMTMPSGAPPPMPARRCPSCHEIVGRESECAHCGAELVDLRIGETLSGRYRVDRLLGAGGMGRVYLGTHLSLEEPVAIKFLLAEWTSRGEFRARFRREAMTLAKLRHPGIVTVHDYGEHEGELYMVMEFVKGRVLRDIVEQGRAVPVSRALQLLDLVLQVIEFAHAQGIVHRDLKPDNAMMVDLGDGIERVKVLDFGLALSTNTSESDRLTATGAVQGTPTYMSPEQCKGRDVGPPTDVYALGVMLYEWLCGDVPFVGTSFSETMAQQMYLPAPSLTERGVRPTNVPPAVEALVRDVLAKQPEARPTASEFRARIAQIQRGDDAVSIANRAAQQRTADAGMNRDERSRGLTAGPANPAVATVTGRVILCTPASARATDLATNFAVNGCAATLWSTDDLPPSSLEGQPVKAILVQWTSAVPQRIAAIRSRADLAKVAVIVLDAPDVDATPALIRAGATDVVYANTGADAVCKQTLKLMRRVK